MGWASLLSAGQRHDRLALTVWAWQATGQATALALVGFFGFVPVVLLSPMAGALVDRYNRKKIMMLADFAAGVPTVVILLLYASGSLQIWHLFITLSVSGAFQAFHFPAYSAAVARARNVEDTRSDHDMKAKP